MSAAWAMGETGRSHHHDTIDSANPAVQVAANTHAAPAIKPMEPQFAFLAPIPGCDVNSPFGRRRMPWEEGGRLHEGVDIAAPEGSSVRATANGVIGRTGVSSTYGTFVEIIHADGLSSFYAHLKRVAALRSGQAVTAGQTIAYAGSTGRSTGSHLHFEIRFNDRPLNPALFMGQTFASLKDLPLVAAARIPAGVRMAQVSRWPVGMKLEAEAEPTEMPAAIRTRGARMSMTFAPTQDGRVHGVIQPAVPIDTPRTPTSGPQPGDLPISRPSPQATPAIISSPINTIHNG